MNYSKTVKNNNNPSCTTQTKDPPILRNVTSTSTAAILTVVGQKRARDITSDDTKDVANSEKIQRVNSSIEIRKITENEDNTDQAEQMTIDTPDHLTSENDFEIRQQVFNIFHSQPSHANNENTTCKTPSNKTHRKLTPIRSNEHNQSVNQTPRPVKSGGSCASATSLVSYHSTDEEEGARERGDAKAHSSKKEFGKNECRSGSVRKKYVTRSRSRSPRKARSRERASNRTSEESYHRRKTDGSYSKENSRDGKRINSRERSSDGHYSK